MVIAATTTSASQPKLLAAGRTFVSALAILANPRILFASKTIVLDVQIYLGPADQDLLIGSLRYFNSDNLSFDDGPHLYLIHATVSTQIYYRLNINQLIFSSLDENPRLMCQFQVTEQFWTTPSSVTYSG